MPIKIGTEAVINSTTKARPISGTFLSASMSAITIADTPVINSIALPKAASPETRPISVAKTPKPKAEPIMTPNFFQLIFRAIS